MSSDRIEDWTSACFGTNPDDHLHAAGTSAQLVGAANAVHLVMYTNDDKGFCDRSASGRRASVAPSKTRRPHAWGIPREDLR